MRDRLTEDSQVDGLELGVDPGAEHTGIAAFTTSDGVRRGFYAIQIEHRGNQIKNKMRQRAAYRRRRRSQNLRVPCNQAKSNRSLAEFMADRPEVACRIMAMASKPLHYAAAVNATRYAIRRALKPFGVPLYTATGGRTKWNRHRSGASKSHTIDALHVGELTHVVAWPGQMLVATASGRGAYQRTTPNRHGFARLIRTRTKRVRGFATGDLVLAVIPKGKNAGNHSGRVAIRSRGSFNIRTQAGLIESVSHKHCRILQRGDGWSYQLVREGDGVVSRPRSDRALVPRSR